MHLVHLVHVVGTGGIASTFAAAIVSGSGAVAGRRAARRLRICTAPGVVQAVAKSSSGAVTPSATATCGGEGCGSRRAAVHVRLGMLNQVKGCQGRLRSTTA